MKKLLLLIIISIFSIQSLYAYTLREAQESSIKNFVDLVEKHIIFSYTTREAMLTSIEKLKEIYVTPKQLAILGSIEKHLNPTFDSCGGVDKYKYLDRFNEFEDKIKSLPSIVYTSSKEFIEGCLTLDNRYLIMLDQDNGLQYGSLIKYDINTKEVYYVPGRYKEIGEIHGTYIDIFGSTLGDGYAAGPSRNYYKFYYMDNVLVYDKKCYYDYMYEKNDIRGDNPIDIPKGEEICEKYNTQNSLKRFIAE